MKNGSGWHQKCNKNCNKTGLASKTQSSFEIPLHTNAEKNPSCRKEDPEETTKLFTSPDVKLEIIWDFQRP